MVDRSTSLSRGWTVVRTKLGRLNEAGSQMGPELPDLLVRKIPNSAGRI